MKSEKFFGFSAFFCDYPSILKKVKRFPKFGMMKLAKFLQKSIWFSKTFFELGKNFAKFMHQNLEKLFTFFKMDG